MQLIVTYTQKLGPEHARLRIIYSPKCYRMSHAGRLRKFDDNGRFAMRSIEKGLWVKTKTYMEEKNATM